METGPPRAPCQSKPMSDCMATPPMSHAAQARIGAQRAAKPVEEKMNPSRRCRHP